MTKPSTKGLPVESMCEVSKQISDHHPFFLFDWYQGFLFFREELARSAYVKEFGKDFQGEIVMGVVTHEGFGNHGKPANVRCLGS